MSRCQKGSQVAVYTCLLIFGVQSCLIAATGRTSIENEQPEEEFPSSVGTKWPSTLPMIVFKDESEVPAEFPSVPPRIGNDVPPMVYLSREVVTNDSDKSTLINAVRHVVNKSRDELPTGTANTLYNNLNIVYRKSMDNPSNLHVSVATVSNEKKAPHSPQVQELPDDRKVSKSDQAEMTFWRRANSSTVAVLEQDIVMETKTVLNPEDIKAAIEEYRESRAYLEARAGHDMFPVILVCLLTFAVSLYIGLVTWRKVLENRYGSRVLLLGEDFPDRISYI